jgi:hypothetical protein
MMRFFKTEYMVDLANMKHPTLNVTFTDVLYAVVAGAAFEHFDPYNWSTNGWNNSILLVSIAILLEDWILYHAQVSRITSRDLPYAGVLFYDVLVLVLWYTMARAGTIGPSGLYWFLSLLSVFYLLGLIFEVIFIREHEREMSIRYDIFSVVTLASIAVLLYELKAHLYLWMIPASVALIVPFRYKGWRMVFSSSK